MRATAILLLLTLLSLLGIAAQAQEGTYRLQPLDVIRIQVYDEPQVNAVLPIGRDGNISVPFVGIVKASGRTTSELEAELSQLYEEKLRRRNPHVAVTIEQFRPVRASITGMVNAPGVYEFRPGDTVMTLISRGGGVNTDRADLRRATLRRGNSRELIGMDLYAMLNLQDTSQNYEIQDGDELNVPEETRNRILVLGAIQQPGPYPYKEPMHLADAITMAKGPIPVRSMMSRITVMREQPGRPGSYQRIPANFVRFIRNGDNSQNILLQPGDLIYVGETKTPDIAELSTILSNTIFIFDRLHR
jgi:polysaccharide export outer membrane protein